MIERIYNNRLLVAACLVLVHFLFFYNTPFFWDATSKFYRASWIYDQDLTKFIIPESMSSGHPPLYIGLLATFWTLFGKKLIVARILSSIILFGVLNQLIILVNKWWPKNLPWYFILIIFIEPTFLAQTTTLNNDLLLLFFFLLAFNSLSENRKTLYFIGLTGLLFTNLRGIYFVLALISIDFLYSKYQIVSKDVKRRLSYVASILLYLIYGIYHYSLRGWFVIKPTGGYSNHRKVLDDSSEIFTNFLVFGKAFLEYGRFIIVIVIIAILSRKSLNQGFKGLGELIKKESIYVISLACLLTVLFLGMVPFSNPIANRYFTVCFIILNFLAFSLISKHFQKHINLIFTTIIVFFISGHFWIYPSTFPQDWDSTLAYTNYFKLERNMNAYIDAQNIPKKAIGWNLNSIDDQGLPSIDQRYSRFDMDNMQYVLITNVDNLLKDENLQTIINEWQLVHEEKKLGVFLSLYKKKH